MTPHIRDTNHLFLELPLLKDKLEEYINKMSVVGSWSQNAIQTTNAWLKEGLNDVLPGIWSGGFQFHLRDLVIRLLVVDRRTCWIHASLFKFYLKFWQIDLSIYLWWIGFLCLVWCACCWICFYYCLPHTWMGDVVEESWRCRVVSVYGQGQCALPHCKWFFVKIFW